MSDAPIYRAFLGSWVLVPESCDYEQSEPPKSGTHRISETSVGLRFDMSWVDAMGEEHSASFSGIPDGELRPFDGGELADALSITAASERDLRSSVFYRGTERMAAQYQLDDTGQAMRVTQLVRLPDGTAPINTGTYRKQASS